MVRSRRRPLIVLPSIALTLAGLGCGQDPPSAAESAETATVERPPTRIEIVTLDSTSFEETIRLTGETAPVRSAVIAAQVPGRIVAFSVTEGEPVTQGEAVLRIDTATSVAQRAQLETQIAAYDRDITRNEQLLERGLGTATELEHVRTQRELAAEQLAALDVSIGQGRMAAPIAGIVTQKLAEVGEYAQPGEPLARIVDVSTVVVWVGLPERELGAVREGMPVSVQIPATGASVTGTLHRIGVEGDVASRTFPLEIRIDNSDGTLRAGMRCTVELTKRQFDDVVVVPRDAVLQGLEGAEVFVADGESAAVRPVELGPGRGSFTVVLAGVAAGDRLVVRGHRVIVPGERVLPVDVGTCCSGQLAAYLGGSDGAGDGSGAQGATAPDPAVEAEAGRAQAAADR